MLKLELNYLFPQRQCGFSPERKQIIINKIVSERKGITIAISVSLMECEFPSIVSKDWKSRKR